MSVYIFLIKMGESISFVNPNLNVLIIKQLKEGIV